MPQALIVEDDIDSAQALALLIQGEGFDTAIAHSLAEARRQALFRAPDVVLLDLQMPDGSGIELLREWQGDEHGEVVLITGHASLQTSIEALRLGAVDYLVKPISGRQIRGILSRLRPPDERRAQAEKVVHEFDASGRFGRLWGRAPPMRALFDQVARVARTGVSVFISGESGTGKELVAQTLHELSPRADRPFVAVNCGAISPQLIESEIFGHEKGSFTGATRQHRGHFERAHGGTLLLDEITEMPLELQVKLLRVLETGTVLRIGGDAPLEVEVRIVAATNRPPPQALADGKLREDLYYRLNVFHLAVPPLRDRSEDIELLANRFLDELKIGEGRQARFTPAALDELRDYAWPGNVRQLRNLVQRAAIMADGPLIDVDDLLFDSAEVPAAAGRSDWVSVPIGTSIAEMERRLILATLEHHGGRRERVAELLGISAKTLYNRLREYRRDEQD